MWADTVVTFSWLVFVVVWIATPIIQHNKVGVFRADRRGAWVRIVIALLVLAVWRWNPGGWTGQPPALQELGAVMAAAGIAFAVWARLYLGRNWGMPMSHIESAELVIDGPYKLVRHPIYTGVLTAMAGTTIAASWELVLPFALMAVYFGYAATQEEKRMHAEFGPKYDAYRRRSKMLVPWLF